MRPDQDGSSRGRDSCVIVFFVGKERVRLLFISVLVFPSVLLSYNATPTSYSGVAPSEWRCSNRFLVCKPGSTADVPKLVSID